MTDVPGEAQRSGGEAQGGCVLSSVEGETSAAEAARKHGHTIAEIERSSGWSSRQARWPCSHLHDRIGVRRPGQHGLERLDREVPAADQPLNAPVSRGRCRQRVLCPPVKPAVDEVGEVALECPRASRGVLPSASLRSRHAWAGSHCAWTMAMRYWAALTWRPPPRCRRWRPPVAPEPQGIGAAPPQRA